MAGRLLRRAIPLRPFGFVTEGDRQNIFSVFMAPFGAKFLISAYRAGGARSVCLLLGG